MQPLKEKSKKSLIAKFISWYRALFASSSMIVAIVTMFLIGLLVWMVSLVSIPVSILLALFIIGVFIFKSLNP